MEQEIGQIKREVTLSRQLTQKFSLQQQIHSQYQKNFTSQQIALYFSYLNNYSSSYQQLKKEYKYIQNMSTNQKRYLLNYSMTHIVKGSQICEEIEQMKREIIKVKQKNQFIRIEDDDQVRFKYKSDANIQQNSQKNDSNVNITDNKAILQNNITNHYPLNIVVIIIHGKLIHYDKTFTSGQQLIITQQQPPIYNLKSQFAVCILLQKHKFQSQLIIYNQFHFKKKCLQQLFLSKIGFNLSYKRTDQLVGYIQNVKNNLYQNKFLINMDAQQKQYCKKGVYLIVKGQFQIYKCQNGKKIRVGEISEGYFGEESIWTQFQYKLIMKSKQAEVLFLNKKAFKDILSQEQFTLFKQKLMNLYQIKNQTRLKHFNSILKIAKRIKDENKIIKKVQRSYTQKTQNQEKLNLMLMNKPQWLIEKQKKQSQKLNRRKNLFNSQKVQFIKQKRKKYFSVKLSSQKDQRFQKQVMKKHLADKQKDDLKLIKSQVKILDLNNTIDFSKFAKTSFLNTSRKINDKQISSSPKAQKHKSQSKFQKTQLKKQIKKTDTNKWDSTYSKYYDRVLADSVKKQKHLSLILRLKSKLFPQKRGEMFTFKDAAQTKQMSFYQIQRKRRQQSEQKNKREFQKIFKTKLLTTTPTTRYPATFR